MDPAIVFCPNLECPARGQAGQGNSRRHSRKSVLEMSLEAKSRETMVSGWKGPSMYGRNLGTSARCSDG
jgi:hypothetical protein